MVEFSEYNIFPSLYGPLTANLRSLKTQIPQMFCCVGRKPRQSVGEHVGDVGIQGFSTWSPTIWRFPFNTRERKGYYYPEFIVATVPIMTEFPLLISQTDLIMSTSSFPFNTELQ